MQYIDHISTPTRLLLVWQAPDGRDRTRFVVGEILRDGEQVSFRYLTDTADFVRAREHGFVCYPAFRKTDRVYSDGVMDSFLRRLPPRKRGDFAKYLEQWRLSPSSNLSDFALLAYSGAKLPSDGFSIDWPLDDVTAPCELLLEVAGFRYQEDVSIDELREGMSVTFRREPDNIHDPHALAVEFEGRRIGYIKRTQCEAVSRWLLEYDVEAVIERLNGTPERPIIYLFCRIREKGAHDLVQQIAM